MMLTPPLNLSAEVYNGATVSDWLGTAMVAARVGAGHVEAIRDNRVVSVARTLRLAEADFAQALSELQVVMRNQGITPAFDDPGYSTLDARN